MPVLPVAEQKLSNSRLPKNLIGIWLLIAFGPQTLSWGAEHHYRVVVDDGLQQVAVRAQLVGNVSRLSARDGEVSKLSDLATCEGERLSSRRDRIDVHDAGCVSYRYPLRAALDARMPAVADNVVVSSPSQWLWIPPLAPGDRLHIELALPGAMQASVPWRAVGEHKFELSASPQSSRAVVVFGHFEQRNLELSGSQLRVALVDGLEPQLAADKIVAWLRAAAEDVVGVSGRFPNPAPQIIVQPSVPQRWGSGKWGAARSAVPFGYVIRDGGEAVRFFVAADRPLDDYLADWTATHEFSHLLLPYVNSQDKWISEGFASYYQNVLLARRGVYSEQDAWRRLHRSFQSAGAISNPPKLSHISDRPFGEVRMLIYWSGAAIALMADAELRRLSGSAESLDTILARLQACCLPSRRAWSGEELFAKFDELSKYPIFKALYARHANSPGMPRLQDLYARLGLIPTGASTVTLSDKASDAHVRRAIMGNRAELGEDHLGQANLDDVRAQVAAEAR